MEEIAINNRFVSIHIFAHHFSPLFIARWTFGSVLFLWRCGDRIVFTVIRRQRSMNLIDLFQFGRCSENILHDLNFHWNDMCPSRFHILVRRQQQQQPVTVTAAVKWICIARPTKSIVHRFNLFNSLCRVPTCATRVHSFMASAEIRSSGRNIVCRCVSSRCFEKQKPWSVKSSWASEKRSQCEIAPIKMQINLVMKIVEWFKYCVACYTANPINALRLARDSDARFESNGEECAKDITLFIPIHTASEVWMNRLCVVVIWNQRRAHATSKEMDIIDEVATRWSICCVDRTNLLCSLFEHPRNRGKSVVEQDEKTLIGHWSRRSSFLSVHTSCIRCYTRRQLSTHSNTSITSD